MVSDLEKAANYGRLPRTQGHFHPSPQPPGREAVQLYELASWQSQRYRGNNRASAATIASLGQAHGRHGLCSHGAVIVDPALERA